MATARLYRILATLTLLALAPCLARDARAQAAIRVGAFVSQPTGTVALHNDSAIAAPTNDIQRVRIAGVGGLDVRAGQGSIVRVTNREAEPSRPVRITIEFVGS
jgi:uncharacterized protein YcgI (DUF1989 family)